MDNGAVDEEQRSVILRRRPETPPGSRGERQKAKSSQIVAWAERRVPRTHDSVKYVSD